MKGDKVMRFAADIENLSAIRRFVEERAVALGAGSEAVAELILAVNEAVTNTIVHGYQGLPGVIELEIRQNQGDLWVTLRDEAPQFDPSRAPIPDINASLSVRPFGGMGVHMMRYYTDELRYRVTPDGKNELTLVKSGVF
jgi:anti-sigma regulatory factor (Ser/Thr protein kinase)